MFSHFKSLQHIATVCTLFILHCGLLIAQTPVVTPIITVVPPYGNKLSDYTSMPNKIMIILNVSNFADLPANQAFYIEGSINSTDESIQISTKQGHKPSVPLIINRTGGQFLPYQLTYPQVREIFNDQWLVYRGITREEVFKNGLPEGTYRICIRVFNYNTGELVSNSACSNVFSVSDVDAPIIIQPMHQSEISFMPVNNLVFSWTPPPGAPINTQYKLRIVEIKNNVNPLDALRATGYPKFFETTVTGTTYLYSAANPPLTPGKQYAFIVVAVDPSGNTKFRNMGASPMHVFTYKNQQTPMSAPANFNPQENIVNYNVQKTNLPVALVQTKVKGTLKYKYQGGSQTYPLEQANIRLIAIYVVQNPDGSSMVFDDGFVAGWPHYPEYFKDGPMPGDEIAPPVKTDDNGNFEFAFFTNYRMGLVDDNYQCSPSGPAMRNIESRTRHLAKTGKGNYGKPHEVVFYNQRFNEIHIPKFTNSSSSANIYASELNLNGKGGYVGNLIGSKDFNNLSTSGNNSGNCKLYRYYAVAFTEPYSSFYLNPDKDPEHRMIVQPGETHTANLVTKVRSVSLSVKALSTNYSSITKSNDIPEIMGMDVYLLRKKLNNPTPYSPFPKDDVIPDKTDDFPLKPTIMNNFEIVGKKVTDQNGYATFNNVVYGDIASYMYFVYASNAIRTTDFNFKDYGPELVYLSELKVKGTTTYQTAPSFGDHSLNNWGYPNLENPISMDPLYPWVFVELFDNFGRRISTPASVILEGNCNISSGDKKYKPHFPIIVNAKQGDYPFSHIMVRTDTSLYQYGELELVVDNNNLVKGPLYTVHVKCPGYKETSVDITEPIKLGQKKYRAIELLPGADVKGKVLDAETQKPLEGVSVKMSYNTNGQLTDASGNFSDEPALLLPGITQYLVCQKDGYVTDSVEIQINGPHKIAQTIYMYKNYRRLKIHVLENSKLTPLKGIKVTLPGVKIQVYGLSQNGALNNASYGMQVNNNSAQITRQGANNNINSSNARNSQLTVQPQIQSTGANHAATIVNASNSGYISGFVNNNTTREIPLSAITDDNGYATFAFRSQEDNDMMFEVVAENPESNAGNYISVPISLKIPNGKTTTHHQLLMKKGTCLEGKVYAGESNASPVEEATVRINMGVYGEVSTKTDVSGNFKLRNVSCINGFIRVEISKSGIAGDKFPIYNAQPSDVCIVRDYHLKTFDGIDLSKLLGFAIEPIIEEDKVNETITMSGTLKNVSTGNFKSAEDIPFYGVVFKKDKQTQQWVFDGNEVNTTKNYVNLSVFNNYQGRAVGTNGIKVERIGTTETGNIKGKVRVDSTNFGGMGFSLPGVFLSNTTGVVPILTVFTSETGGNNNPTSYNVCNIKGEDVRYTIKGFQDGALAKAASSKFNNNGLFLNTTLTADIYNISPSNLTIDVGNVQFTKSGMVFSTSNPLNIGLGNWQLKCTNWTIGNEGLIVNSGVLETGADIPFENLRISSTSLKTDLMTLHFDKMKLLGVHDLVVLSDQTTFNYTYTWGGVYAWQVYVRPQNGQSVAAYIQGLPAIAPTDRVEFSNILMNNQGENMLQMIGKTFKLHNFIDFTPNPGELMQLTKDYFSMRGAYQLNIPYAELKFGDALFYKQNNKLVYEPKYVEALNFTHQNVKYEMYLKSLGDRVAVAKGIVQEPGNLPSLNITLTHTPNATKIEIDPGQKIQLGASNYLDQVAGGNNVLNHQWQTFHFDGYPKGMGGISENNQKMSFEVAGAVKATGQNISVSEIPSFPGMTFTYEMSNSRLIGYCDLNMNLNGIKLSGGVNAIMDGKGWIFQADGSMDVPGFGGMNLFGLFGNYSGIPPEFAAKFGSALCLPAGFTQNIKGFFLTAGITKHLLPNYNTDLGIVSINAGVDLSLDARIFMQFGGGGNTYGLGVLARGSAYVSGSCDATCTTLSASAQIQAGVSGTYKAGTYNIDGCTSVSLGLTAQQCFPLVPITGICGPCFSVSLPSLVLGATMHLDSTGGFSMGLTTSSCDSQCH